jgi:hypothetical protein
VEGFERVRKVVKLEVFYPVKKVHFSILSIHFFI